MNMILVLAVTLLALFTLMLAFLEMGRRLGMRRRAEDSQGAEKGLGAVEGAIFGLLGLLIAFTFSGAGERFQHRRELIVEEANAISTAWMRIDLLPPDAQPAMRELFRQYVDARLGIYQKLPDRAASLAENTRSVEFEGEIWEQAISASRARETNTVSVLLLPALNEMFDMTTTRAVAAETHPPSVIYAMLLALALLCSLLAGYDMAESRTRNWLHTVGFALIMTLTLYVIVDLEYPRLGFIRIDAADHILAELRASMK
jgi:hypothetical protein